MRSLVLRTTAQSFFDQSDPSVVPFKRLFRTEVSIETLFGSEKIGRPSDFLHVPRSVLQLLPFAFDCD
jgi:hypothetical protein